MASPSGVHQQSCFMSPVDLPLDHRRKPPDDPDIALLLHAHRSHEEAASSATSLPRRELFLIWIIHASQGFQTTMLFPMLVFMVERYGVAERGSESTGRYAGLLASLFPLAQFCTSILWGTISDRTGRRPILALGNAVSATSALLLGLCNSFPAACTVRFVGGLLNGTMTATKSVIGELCDGTNKASGFGILNLAWGVGSVAGPVISGLLAQPCNQYGWDVCPAVLSHYPFLLPCLAATAFSVLGIIASTYLKETLPSRQTAYHRISSDASLKNIETGSECWDPTPMEDVKGEGCISGHPGLQVSESRAAIDCATSAATGPGARIFRTLESEEIQSNETFIASHQAICEQHGNRVPGAFRLIIRTKPGLDLEMVPTSINTGIARIGCQRQTVRDSDLQVAKVISTGTCGSRDGLKQKLKNALLFPTIAPLLRDRDVLLSSFCYSMTGLVFIITDELFPIFGAASTSIGGLGFSSASLGIILGEGGVVLFLYTLLLYPAVARWLGPLKGFQLGILCAAPLWIVFPASSLLADMPKLQWSILLMAMAARSMVACTCFTGVLILVSNSASPANMGAVTGLSHSLCSFFRAIGPACGGMVWSVASQHTFRFHQFLAWQFVTVLTAFTFALSFLLSPSLTMPKGEAAPASMASKA